MNNIISKIRTYFPDKEVNYIYNLNSSKCDIIIVEDWSFFQFSTKYEFETIVVITSIEDYVNWRRMLKNSVYRNTEIYILIKNLKEFHDYSFFESIKEQDRASGIKFL